MKDALGAVNDLILTYVKNNDVGLLSQPQIIRGWQNVVSALPKDSQEYAVLTLLATIRHGTNVHRYTHADGDTGLVETVSRMAEHIVQVDFCSAFPQQTEEAARIRAEILETVSRDHVATDFFASYGFSACYAEDVRPLPFQNESEQWVARYVVTMHLSGWTDTPVDLDSFEDVTLYLENVDVHHPVKPTTATEIPYTVENLADAKEGYAKTHITPKHEGD